MPDLDTLRRYAAATSETDGQLLADCMEAAQVWLENAGVKRLADNRLYDLAVYQLATHFFDQRGVVAESPTKAGLAQIPIGVFSIMHQLRLESGVEE